MSTVTITRRNRNLGINATAYANNGPRGWYFSPLEHPDEQGGCATIRRELDRYRRMWGPSTYYRVDLFVGGKRVSHEDGSYENLRNFCYELYDDGNYLGRRTPRAIEVTLEDA